MSLPQKYLDISQKNLLYIIVWTSWYHRVFNLFSWVDIGQAILICITRYLD